MTAFPFQPIPDGELRVTSRREENGGYTIDAQIGSTMKWVTLAPASNEGELWHHLAAGLRVLAMTVEFEAEQRGKEAA